MKYAFLLLCIISFHVYSQNLEPIKFDGILNTDEWANFPSFDISYEIDPLNQLNFI